MNNRTRAWLLSDTPVSVRKASLGRAYRRWRAFSRNPLNMLGLAILLLLIVVALIGPLFTVTTDPLKQVLSDRLMPPGAAHWFGADQLGCDILPRLVHGSRLTLSTRYWSSYSSCRSVC